MKKVFDWFKDNLFLIVLIGVFLLADFYVPRPKMPTDPLKDFKDGVQNHLVWDIKGGCYFVRPNDDVTVYLVPVVDCNKK